MKVAIIPARGGSKRIPRKNIREFCGKPIIGWSIEAAKASGCFDKVIVSTDDDEIASIAQKYGAAIPFKRPSDLSGDHTGTGAVMKHAISQLAEHGTEIDLACCIYATAPFVTDDDLRFGLALMNESSFEFVFTVTSYAFPIQRAIKINDEERVEMFDPASLTARSQDLVEAWHDAGQFYWGTEKAWMEERPVFSNLSTVVKIPRHRAQDIDTQEDWVRAEWLFRQLREENMANPEID